MGEIPGSSSQMTETTMPYSPHLHDSAADADQSNANERPLSQLIQAVQGTDAELMKEIAPGVSVYVKRFVKVPMISQLSLAGI